MTTPCLFDTGLMAQIRDRFVNVESDPIVGRRIYFENAGGTLKLKSIFPELELFTALPDNAGRLNATSRKINATLARGREDVALLLGSRSGHIISEQSGTGMIFRITSTVVRSASGTNIVTTNLDHPAVYDAVHILARRHGLECRVAGLDPKRGDVPVENILKLVDTGTVMLAMIHSSNNLGSRNDVTETTRGARRINPEIRVVIDGCQHVSHGLIDVEAYGADAWIFDAYKVYSKIGTNFAHISDRMEGMDRDNLSGKANTDWDLGTREPAAFACISKVVEYFEWLGGRFTDSGDGRARILAAMEAVEAHEAALTGALLRGVDGAPGMLDIDGITVYGETENLDEREAIVAFNVRGVPTAEVVEYFGANGVRVHNRISDAYSRHTLHAVGIEEAVRVSLCHYNTAKEVSVFLRLLDAFARDRC